MIERRVRRRQPGHHSVQPPLMLFVAVNRPPCRLSASSVCRASRVHSASSNRGIMNVSATLQQMPSPSHERWRAPMTASRIPPEPVSLTTPIIDCEPPPVGIAACPPPSPAALHRPHHPAPCGRCSVRCPATHCRRRAAVAFADAALRRVLEVVDRRRPIAQLRPLVTPGADRHGHRADASAARTPPRRCDGSGCAWSTATTKLKPRCSRRIPGRHRVRAIAGRIELVDDRWRIVALQIG